MNRRGSLAISALLNQDAIDPLKNDGQVLSPLPEQQETASNQSQLSKAKRKRISPAQYNRLMEIFDQTDTPSSEIRENLAIELNMTKREVQVWFQNRRAKMNRSKNMHNKRQRHASLIPYTNNFYHSKPRRASAYPVLENSNVYDPPQQFVPPLPPQHHPQQHMYLQQLPPQQQQQQQQPHYPPNYNGRLYPIAPMPLSASHPSMTMQEEGNTHPLQSRHYSPYQQRKPSAIDLLASAAEYVRTDRKEVNYSKT
ncbi:Homeodomain-like DNA binding domain-containing transcription factor [Mucor lusitanicus]